VHVVDKSKEATIGRDSTNPMMLQSAPQCHPTEAGLSAEDLLSTMLNCRMIFVPCLRSLRKLNLELF
jgi:hypothetical protein